jgi:hypothetical protein
MVASASDKGSAMARLSALVDAKPCASGSTL